MSEQRTAGDEARRLLLSASDGVLSTHSKDVPGYPFGSVVPYCLDREGAPILLISDIAQHTKNIDADPKVSLIVVQSADRDVQAHGRLTVLADAERIDAADDVAARYYRFFPQSRGYHQAHGFAFYRLQPMRHRYIGGFGRIHWLEPDDLRLANPFDAEEERAISEHMDADHRKAMSHYCALGGLEMAPDDVSFAGLDAEGFDLLAGGALHRFWFGKPVANGAEARGELVRLARAPLAAG